MWHQDFDAVGCIDADNKFMLDANIPVGCSAISVIVFTDQLAAALAGSSLCSD